MQLWQNWNKKYIALSVREKWLILLSGLVGLFFIMLTLFIDPAESGLKVQKQQVELQVSQNKRLKSEIASAQESLSKDPDKEITEQLKSLSEQSQKLSLKLSEFVGRLSSPSDMAGLLEQVLISSKNLTLEKLESLPAEPIITGESSDAGYYIHPIRIELTGKYFDIQEYLTKLESMDVGYFWRDFHYQVESYPVAKLELVVYTLGTRQEFIGG